MSRSWAGGSTRRWRVKRGRVLLANANQHKGLCRLNVGVECAKHGRPCKGICTGTATEVHHSRGKAYGDDERYLVAACRPCNLHVGMPGKAIPEERPVSSW
jgi:hypothetical protein